MDFSMTPKQWLAALDHYGEERLREVVQNPRIIAFRWPKLGERIITKNYDDIECCSRYDPEVFILRPRPKKIGVPVVESVESEARLLAPGEWGLSKDLAEPLHFNSSGCYSLLKYLPCKVKWEEMEATEEEI